MPSGSTPPSPPPFSSPPPTPVNPLTRPISLQLTSPHVCPYFPYDHLPPRVSVPFLTRSSLQTEVQPASSLSIVCRHISEASQTSSHPHTSTDRSHLCTSSLPLRHQRSFVARRESRRGASIATISRVLSSRCTARRSEIFSPLSPRRQHTC